MRFRGFGSCCGPGTRQGCDCSDGTPCPRSLWCQAFTLQFLGHGRPGGSWAGGRWGESTLLEATLELQPVHAGGPRSRPGWRHRSGRGGTESFPGSDSPRGHPDRISPAQSPEVEVGLRQERGDPLPYRPPAAASTQQAVHMGARGAARQNSTRLPHNYASPELITASQDFPNGALEGLSASQPSIQHTYCRGSSKDLSGKEYWNSHTTDNSRGA